MGPGGLGHWEVEVAAAGKYDITLQFAPQDGARTAELQLGKLKLQLPVAAQAKEVTFQGVALVKGPGRLEAVLIQGDQPQGVQYVVVRKLP